MQILNTLQIWKFAEVIIQQIFGWICESLKLRKVRFIHVEKFLGNGSRLEKKGFHYFFLYSSTVVIFKSFDWSVR